MATRMFNWKLAIVILLMVVVLGISAVGLRAYQRTRQSEAALGIGLKAYEENRWQDAANALGQYIARNREDVDILLKYADAQLKIRPQSQGAIRQAISAYRAVWRLDPANLEAIKPLSELYMATGAVGEAERVLKGHMKVKPKTDPELYYRLAFAKHRLGNHQEAIRDSSSLVSKHPDFIPGFQLMARLAQEHPEDVNHPALYWLDRAVTENPESIEALLARAGHFLETFIQERSPADANKVRVDLEHAEGMEPNQVGDHLRLAELWLGLNEFDRAERQLSKVAEDSGENPTLWRIWAQLALQSRSADKAREIADKGLAALGEHPEGFLVVACELYFIADQPEKAIACINELKSDERYGKVVPFLEGRLAQKQGDHRQAVALYRRALELGYDTPQIRLVLGECLSLAGDMAASHVELQNMVSKYPRFVDGRMALARNLLRQGNWEEARQQAREVLLLRSDSIPAALIELRSRIMILSSTKDLNASVWEGVKSRLDEVEKKTGIVDETKSLRFLLAKHQGDLTSAEEIIGEEPVEGTVAHRQWLLAQVDLMNTRGDQDAVEFHLTRGLKLYPRATRFALLLGTFYLENNKPEQALQVLQNAQNDATKPADKKQIALVLGQLYDRTTQPEKATEILLQLRQENPTDVQILRRLLTRPAYAQDTEKAQSLIDQLKAIEGENGMQWRFEQARLWARDETLKDRYEEIVPLLEACLRANPEDQASRVLLATVQRLTGNLQLAAATYQEALDRAPDDLGIVIQTTNVLLNTRRSSEALSILNASIERGMSHPDLWRLKVAALELQGKADQIGPELERLYEIDPNDMQVGTKLVRLRIAKGRYDEARAILERLAEVDADARELLTVKVDYHLAQGENEKALALCNELVTESMDMPAHLVRARTLTRLSEFDRAEKDYEKAVLLDPNNLALRREKADFHRINKDLPKAIVESEAIYKLIPDSTAMALRLADSYIVAETPAKAVELIQEHLPRSNAELRFTCRIILARALYLSGKKVDGERLFEELGKARPKDTALWGTYLQTTSQTKDWVKAKIVAARWLDARPDISGLAEMADRLFGQSEPEAKDIAKHILEKAVERDSRNSSVLIALAQMLQLSDEMSKAAEHYRRTIAVAQDESHKALATNNLAWILAEVQGQYEEAYAMTSKAIQRYPDYLDLRDTHGVISWRLGKLEEAEEHLKVCVRKYVSGNPSGTKSRFYLGQVYYQMGRKDDATRMLEDARKMHEQIGGLAEEDLTRLKELLPEMGG